MLTIFCLRRPRNLFNTITDNTSKSDSLSSLITNPLSPTHGHVISWPAFTIYGYHSKGVDPLDRYLNMISIWLKIYQILFFYLHEYGKLERHDTRASPSNSDFWNFHLLTKLNTTTTITVTYPGIDFEYTRMVLHGFKCGIHRFPYDNDCKSRDFLFFFCRIN